jgi:60 kDa SS-A/Ro ribonucleoprotein
MAINYTDHFGDKKVPKTPLSEPIPGKEGKMKLNNTGAYSFEVTPWQQLLRFLIIGAEGGTYYVGERELTRQNATNVIKCVKEDGLRAVQAIVEVSHEGRAPKNDAAIFALALAASEGNPETKAAAYAAIPKVCRTGTHLYQFSEAVQNLRSWSRGLRNGVAKFYTGRNADQAAMQIIKYRQRNGWTHRDVLRLCHAATKDAKLNAVLRYAVGKPVEQMHPLIEAFEEAQKLGTSAKDVKKAINLVKEHRLPWEALPTDLLRSADIWEALLPDMPLTALVRNLGRMSNLELFKSSLGGNTKTAVAKITDVEEIRKARMHPLNLLVALKTYSQGHGDKGSLSWAPVRAIVDALDSAFYLGFKAVEPTGLSYLLALDISSSMCGARISGTPLDARTASAAMALVTANVEKDYEIVGFHNSLVRLDKISPKMRLDDVIAYINRLDFGSTDCSAPFKYAAKNNLKVDLFSVYTDCETNTGGHPSQELQAYRRKSGVNARSVVVGMTATRVTVADPDDTGMLDVVGFDTATPQIISEFARGQF